MKRVLKFPIDTAGTHVALPADAKIMPILHHHEGYIFWMWAEVDDLDLDQNLRKFYVIGTGQSYRSGDVAHATCLKYVPHNGYLVFHLIEEMPF